MKGLTPAAESFLADLQRRRARRCVRSGLSMSDAAYEGTALAEAFERGMRQGFIASVDGEAVLSDVNPRQLVLVPKRQLELDFMSARGAT